MKNYKFIVQYDGTNYSGWQLQKNAPSVQWEIQKAVKIILKKEINLIASGRTDAGVHALGQTVNFKTDGEIDLFKFKHSLNALLPRDIAVKEISEAPLEFHARFDAKSRVYFYLFSFGKSPFYFKFSSLNKRLANFDFERLNEISTFLLGKRDFSSFAKNKTETENKVCNLKNIRWRKSGDFAFVFVEANRFLHGMVRALLGTILAAYGQENPGKFLEDILTAGTREAAGQAVEAKGLFLYKVKYSESKQFTD